MTRIPVTVKLDADELRLWGAKHADSGQHGVAHVLFEAARRVENAAAFAYLAAADGGSLRDPAALVTRLREMRTKYTLDAEDVAALDLAIERIEPVPEASAADRVVRAPRTVVEFVDFGVGAPAHKTMEVRVDGRPVAVQPGGWEVEREEDGRVAPLTVVTLRILATEVHFIHDEPHRFATAAEDGATDGR